MMMGMSMGKSTSSGINPLMLSRLMGSDVPKPKVPKK